MTEACEGFAGRPLRIKWPNDVFLDGRKLAGVLIDAGVGSPTTYLIGVGINCNRVRFPPDLEPIATSLCLSTGRVIDRHALLVELAVQIDRMLTDLQQANTAHLERVFRHRLGLVGREVEVVANTTLRGTLTDLDFAHLVLDRDVVLPLGVVRSVRAVN